MDRVSQAIISGTASGAAQDSVVVLTTFAQGERASLCTATLVAPNLILTARHCVSNVDETTACAEDGTPVSGSMIQGNRPADTLVIFTGKDGVAPDSTVEANAAAHGLHVIVDSSTTVCNHDVAFVVLDTPLTDMPVSPMRMGPPAMTETVAAVGWGIDATGTLPTQRMVRWDLSLVGIGPALYPDNPAWGYGDAEFMIGESACAGDSGSPAFASTGAIVGVASRSGNGTERGDNMASSCIGADAHAVYTHLDKFSDLINAAFQTANQPQWLEGQPNPWAPTTTQSTDPATGAATTPGGSATATTPGGSTVVNKDSANANVLGDEPGQSVTESKPEAGGCSTSGNPKSSASGALMLALALLGLRRRRRA